MATNPFSSGLGLFGGETFADVGRAMRQEDELAALRAQKQAPDYISGIIAKANEQMGRNIARQAGGIGSRLLRGTPMEGFIQEDPRLAKIRKRDMDRQTLMKKYETLNADNKITTSEAQSLIDDLLEMGYLPEAKAFADIYQTRRKLDINEIGNKARLQKARNAAKTGTGLKSSQVQDAFEDANGVRYRAVLYNFKDEPPQTFIINDAGDIVPRSKIAGNPSEWKPVDTTGMSSFGRIYETGKKEGAKLGAKQADKWVDVRQSMIDAGNAAKSEFKDLIRAYQLTSKTKTGGLQETVLAVRQYLGVDSGDIGELASLFRTGVISRLKEMGSKPTDKDLEYLESAVQSLGNDRETNQRILKRMVGRVDQIIARGEYLKKNPDMSREDFNNNDYEARTFDWRAESDPPIVTQLPPAGQRSIGDVVRTNMGTFKWNGQSWEKIE